VAQEQGRLAEAQDSYRQALDIYLEFGDRHNASITASQFGIVLANLGGHEEASRVLLYATVSWRQDEGEWSADDLQWLHRERALVGAEAFAALLRDNVPGELAGELTAAIDAAQGPEEDAEPDTSAEPGPGDNP